MNTEHHTGWAALTMVIAAVGAPGIAGASPRTVTLTVTPHASTPTLGQPAPAQPQPYTETLTYNPATGTVSVSEGGSTTTSVNDNGSSEQVPLWPGFGDVQLEHCAYTAGGDAPDISLSTSNNPIEQQSYLPDLPGYTDANGIPLFTLQDSSANGQLVATSAIANGVLTLTWTDPTNLIALNLTCAQVDGETFDFAGFGPATRSPTPGESRAIAAALHESARCLKTRISHSNDTYALSVSRTQGSCARTAADGFALTHRLGTRWHVIYEASAPRCPIRGVPLAVQADLRVCGPGSTW